MAIVTILAHPVLLAWSKAPRRLRQLSNALNNGDYGIAAGVLHGAGTDLAEAFLRELDRALALGYGISYSTALFARMEGRKAVACLSVDISDGESPCLVCFDVAYRAGDGGEVLLAPGNARVFAGSGLAGGPGGGEKENRVHGDEIPEGVRIIVDALQSPMVR